MGYHIKKIERGIYGNFSKIKEEFLELEDAIEQGNKVMTLCEMADIIGAMEGYLEKHCAGITLNDVITMTTATKRAFKDGTRQSIDRISMETESVFIWLMLAPYKHLIGTLNDVPPTVLSDVNKFFRKTANHMTMLPRLINCNSAGDSYYKRNSLIFRWQFGSLDRTIKFLGDGTVLISIYNIYIGHRNEFSILLDELNSEEDVRALFTKLDLLYKEKYAFY